jgi:hypothetical protein
MFAKRTLIKDAIGNVLSFVKKYNPDSKEIELLIPSGDGVISYKDDNGSVVPVIFKAVIPGSYLESK